MDLNSAYLRRWQASSSLWTYGQHCELPGCAALTVWRWSERIPLCGGQLVYQHRVDQGHFPLSGDVVTGEISISGGYKRNKKPKWSDIIKEKTAKRAEMCESGSL